ncbi:outer membrane protein [bacterium A37T11]|nr:outer membrane protein [bacterium A37T11]
MDYIYIIKRIFKIAAGLFLLLMGVNIPSGAQEVIPVKKAINLALSQNLQVKQAQFQKAISEQDVRLAKASFYPALNGSIGAEKSWGLLFDQSSGRLITNSVSVNSASGGLQTDIQLFDGFQRNRQLAANKLKLQADMSYVDKVKNDLVLNVLTTYLDALTNQDILTASKQQLSLSQEQLRTVQVSYDVGQKTLADLSQAKSQVATDELNVVTAQNAFDLAILTLKQYMEMTPETNIELERPALPDSLFNTNQYTGYEVFVKAVEDYPDIQQAKFNTLWAKKNIAINKSALYPSLSLAGSVGTRYSSSVIDNVYAVENGQPVLVDQRKVSFNDQLDRNLSESVGLSLKIPIFNNLQTRVAIKKAEINYQNAINDELLARNNLNKVINQAVLDLRSSQKKFSSTEAAFRSADDAFGVIRERFSVGLANAVEQATAQTNRNKAEFDAIQAKYELIFRSKVIDFYLGNPIDL